MKRALEQQFKPKTMFISNLPVRQTGSMQQILKKIKKMHENKYLIYKYAKNSNSLCLKTHF